MTMTNTTAIFTNRFDANLTNTMHITMPSIAEISRICWVCVGFVITDSVHRGSKGSVVTPGGKRCGLLSYNESVDA